MKLHDPIAFEAHRGRTDEQLIYIANLAGWTLPQAIERQWEMSDVEIEDGVEIPTEPVTPPKKRGRKPGTSNKPPEGAALFNAVDFVSCVETEAFEMSKYCAFANNHVIAYSNTLAACHPAPEELSLCPQTEKLKAALMRCGRTMAITETGAAISVKGDKLRALVPCLAEPLAPITPDQALLTGDFDILKEAFKACNTVADEKAERPMFASILLDPNVATATNGMVMLQYWHGINMPPGTVIPKVFAQAIVSCKYKITGIGANWDNELGFTRSITFWFENGAWLKTQCYEDRWQAFAHILDVGPLELVPVYDGLFEAIAAVEPFVEDSSAVYFHNESVASHKDLSAGAMYEVKGLPAGKIINGKLARQVAPFVKTIDLTTKPDRVFFFGDNIRGVFMGMAGSQ